MKMHGKINRKEFVVCVTRNSTEATKMCFIERREEWGKMNEPNACTHTNDTN